MNKESYKQLWIVVNILRGSMSAESIVKVMVYSLLIKFIEEKHKNENAFPFFDEKYSLGYLALTYGKMISDDDIKEYLTNAETELGITKGIISDEFYNLTSNSDCEKIKQIFGAIDSVNQNNYREYFDTAVFLLEQMVLSSGKTSGEYLTNSSLAKLIGKLLDCKPGMSLYDGFCGYGVLADTVASNNCTVYIQDINKGTISIAAVLTALGGTSIGSISCGDSLLNPIEKTMKYDRIVVDPPFGVRYDSEYMKNIPIENYFDTGSEDKESIFVRHAIAHMKDDGIAAVIVPMGLLFRSGRLGTAREVYASQYVDAVIELPAGIITNTSVAAAILILKKKNRFDDIFMINAKEFTERTEKIRTDISASGIEEIVRIYRNREIIEGVSNSVSHEILAENEYNMCTTPYVITHKSRYTEESVIPYIKKYNELSDEVSKINSELTALRERFCK